MTLTFLKGLVTKGNHADMENLFEEVGEMSKELEKNMATVKPKMK